MFQSKFARALIIGMTGCLISSATTAHEFIASTAQSTIAPGQPATISLDSTHQFGAPEEAEAIENVRARLITDAGQTELDVTPNPNAPNLVASVDDHAQTGWIAAHRLPVVWSQTPDGWQEGGLEQHPDALTASRYEKFAKHLIGPQATDDNPVVTTPLGDRLEIVPLGDPRRTKIGTDAEFRILLDGQPLTTNVLATYAGFTQTPSSWAYYTETLADDRGSAIAKVRISAPGLWIVRVATDIPDAADGVRVHNLRATLSFHVDG
ncbi:DUF4198 domain-containing protein [Thalassospira povalilytica]|uniref:DUF4198 domain-containing protein n=1 Tax=Thalassospira povalilytica TaxID=732237 RepID=UPI001D1935B8|nr:DUF4198 domain-containing protein [Thalassospira povalilytica]MCC4238910.1 DUF4198 domain-containing protein [Thalassospira povalilytica]